MTGRLVLLALLAALVGLPFALRPERPSAGPALGGPPADTVVVITPHNEAIRSEFARAFSAWHQARTGRPARVDWRVLGGTSEINRYLESEYEPSFRRHWEEERGRRWSAAAALGFATDAVPAGASPADAAVRREARAAFLASSVGIGIDVFFGGGAPDYVRHAEAGRLVPAGLEALHPEWFRDEVFPAALRGEPFRDPQGRWYGATISSFGIAFNRDSLLRLGLEPSIQQWEDLANPRLRGQLALADPTKSGSVNKAFELILQQQMQRRLAERIAAGVGAAEAEEQAVAEGWLTGLRLIQRLAGNARYWTDNSQKPPIDVGAGNSAAGMAIDFYGRFQAERSNDRGGRERVGFVTPVGGSTFSVDPIGLLRGAPHPATATAFLEFVLSPAGQRLWNQRAGTEGGPVRFNLRRQPVRADLYQPWYEAERTDPGVNPFSPRETFVYRRTWTGPIFREIAFVIRVLALDPAPELKAAWAELIDRGFPADALARFEDLSVVDHAAVVGEIRSTLRSRERDARVRELALAQRLTRHFQRQYEEARRLARAHPRAPAAAPAPTVAAAP